ncbi:12279_t:CDS:2, partial [Acaulospora colombiana]
MTSVDKQPPGYSNGPSQLPPTFPVGKHNTVPLVTVQDLQAHLRILGAFYKLKQDVHGMVNGSDKEKDEAWVVYVSRAVHRRAHGASFVFTGKQLQGRGEERFILYRTLLRFMRIVSDALELIFGRRLTFERSFPVQLVASLIDPDTLDAYPPSNERKAFFEGITKEPFTLPLTTATSDILSLSCPCCDKTADKLCERVYETDDWDSSLCRRGDEETGETASLFCVSMFSLYGLHMRINAVFSLSKHCEDKDIGAEARKLAAGLEWSPATLAENLQIGLQPKADFNPDRIIPSNPGPASIDLVGAVLRQSTFVAKMYEMGWSKPGQVPQDQKIANL